MTNKYYEMDEHSIEAAAPIELLVLTDATSTWRYTTACDGVSYGGNSYTAEPGLKIGEVEVAHNVLRVTLQIEASWSCGFVSDYITGEIDAPVEVTVYRGCALRTLDSDSVQQWWTGYVKTVTLSEPTRRKATLACVPVWTDLGRAGLCLRYGRLCQVPLYSTPCGVDKTSYKATGTVASVDGVTITSTTFGLQADDYYTGGQFESGGVKRLISAHTGETITLASSIGNLIVGASFDAYPGCDHTIDICHSKFSNRLNFRGQPWLPDLNLHDAGVA